ncbi:MAG: hypothetical protein ACWGO1_10665, partial [Anaerolineales bacterium]
MSVEMQPQVVVACPADSVEQMGYLALMLSGLAPMESLTLTLTYPDGSLISHTLEASRGTNGFVRYEFIPDLADPTGEYRFTFQTSSGDYEKELAVTPPEHPRLYLLPELRQLWLV